MKCGFCGADMKIEDEVCPYCGMENPDARKHRQDMKHYKGEFLKTKKDVYTTAGRFTGMTVKVTIIAVLLMLNLLLLFGQAGAWSIGRVITEGRIMAQAKTHEQVLSEMEQEGRFLEFHAYYEANQIYHAEEFRHFRQVERSCRNYSYLYEQLMKFWKHDETYRKPGDILANISGYLDEIYKYMDEESRWDPECYTQAHLDSMEAVKEEAHRMLAVYCNVPLETVETFPDLSRARRQIILEEGLGDRGSEKE